jgi:hypothetical protein
MKSINLKQIFAIILIFAVTAGNMTFAQNDSTKNKIIEKKIIIVEDNDGTRIITDSAEINSYEAETSDVEKEKEIIRIEIENLEDELEDLAEELEEEFGNKDEDNDKVCSKKHKKFDGNWSGFEFGLNNYVVQDLDFNLPEENSFMDLKPNLSWGFSLNLPEVSIPLFCKYMGLVSGLGLEWNNYRFSQNIDLITDSTGVIAPQYIDQDVMKYQKNSLNALYLNIPLIYEIQIPVNKKDKRIFLGVGVVGGVKLASKTKKTIDYEGKESTIRNSDDYNLNPFKYGLTARFGYDDAQVYVNYGLSTLFEKDGGPELFPVSAGLRINF